MIKLTARRGWSSFWWWVQWKWRQSICPAAKSTCEGHNNGQLQHKTARFTARMILNETCLTGRSSWWPPPAQTHLSSVQYQWEACGEAGCSLRPEKW